jgi:hypothetical protein
MPIFVPRLIYAASSVQGWFLLHLSTALAQAESSDRDGKPLIDMTTLGA